MAAGRLYQGAVREGLAWKMVSWTDIGHLRPQQLTQAELARGPLIPYCFDLRTGTIIFCAGIDPTLAMAAEFHYDYLRTHARRFIEMPPQSFRSSEEAARAGSVLLFSPGRCGSTLLAKVIRAMGGVCISEPDFYSQFAYYAAHVGAVVPADRHLLEMARQVLVAPWRKSPSPVVLKMRSHANRAPTALLPAGADAAKVVFLMRRFEPWCESRMRAFGGMFRSHMDVYHRTLLALQQLQQNARCLLLDYDDMNSASPAWATHVAAFLGLTFDEASVRNVLDQDSQQGTPLAAEQLSRQITPELRNNIAAAWRASAPAQLLAAVGLSHYGSP